MRGGEGQNQSAPLAEEWALALEIISNKTCVTKCNLASSEQIVERLKKKKEKKYYGKKPRKNILDGINKTTKFLSVYKYNILSQKGDRLSLNRINMRSCIGLDHLIHLKTVSSLLPTTLYYILKKKRQQKTFPVRSTWETRFINREPFFFPCYQMQLMALNKPPC